VPNDTNVIAAFTEEQVERLTGLSKRQLRYWDRTGFFVPSSAAENRRVAFSRIYSFRDILALRTLGILRNQYEVSLQHLREVADKLRHLSDTLWISESLYVLGRRVVVGRPTAAEPIDAVTGQLILPTIPLEQIVSDTKRAAAELRSRPADTPGRVTRSRYVNHNAWVIAGTRISTRSIREFHNAGYSSEQIMGEYPDLTDADIQAALDHEDKTTAAA
jgi:uncharacterized protein (DUF433 family)